MEQDEHIKIVYEDKGITKVIKGRVLKDEEFTIEILADITSEKIIIGKRALIKIQSLNGVSR